MHCILKRTVCLARQHRTRYEVSSHNVAKTCFCGMHVSLQRGVHRVILAAFCTGLAKVSGINDREPALAEEMAYNMLRLRIYHGIVEGHIYHHKSCREI